MKTIDQLFSLSGRVALVTGGSSGIGGAIARGFAKAGASVVIAALPGEESALQENVAQMEAIGGRAAYLTCDVSDLDSLTAMATRSSSFYGDPDILVNAAGVNLRQPWAEITSDSWNKTLDINLKAPFFLARLLIPAMQKKGWGKIINIAPLQAERAFPNSVPYGASKGGVMQLTRAMAEAWSGNQSGITCNAIGPGFFRTGLTAVLYNHQNVIDSLAKQTIIGRNGELEDLQGVSVFLASAASDYITGQTIYLGGGWTAR